MLGKFWVSLTKYVINLAVGDGAQVETTCPSIIVTQGIGL